jgi:hypothetical protein
MATYDQAAIDEISSLSAMILVSGLNTTTRRHTNGRGWEDDAGSEPFDEDCADRGKRT